MNQKIQEATLKNQQTKISSRTQHWRHLYQEYLINPNKKNSSKIRVICYQAWPLLFNRVMVFFEHYISRKLIKRYCPDLHGKRILDIGCGTGRWCEFFKQYGTQVIGTDLFGNLLANNKDSLPDIAFSAMGATQLALKTGSIDFVNAAIVLEYVPNDEKKYAIREIARVLKPGGFIFILEPVASKNYQESRGSSLLQPKEWKELLTACSLNIIGQQSLHAYPLASLYKVVVSWIGFAIKKIKNLGPKRITLLESSSYQEQSTADPVKKRHRLYHLIDQFVLRIIACLSFPVEFLWLAFNLDGSHRMFLVQKNN